MFYIFLNQITIKLVSNKVLKVEANTRSGGNRYVFDLDNLRLILSKQNRIYLLPTLFHANFI